MIGYYPCFWCVFEPFPKKAKKVGTMLARGVFGACLGWSSRNSGDVGCEPVCVGYFGDVRALQVEVLFDVIFVFKLNTF